MPPISEVIRLPNGDFGIEYADGTNKTTSVENILSASEKTAVQALVLGDRESATDTALNLLRASAALSQRGAPASVTGVTAETLLCPLVTLPGGAMGANGVLRIESAWTSSATVNLRTMTIKIGGVVVWARGRSSASSISEVPLVLLQNRGVQTSQIHFVSANAGYGGNLSVVPSVMSIDFGVDQQIGFYGTVANAADTVTLENYNITIERVV